MVREREQVQVEHALPEVPFEALLRIILRFRQDIAEMLQVLFFPFGMGQQHVGRVGVLARHPALASAR
jgi:hypothetical protein